MPSYTFFPSIPKMVDIGYLVKILKATKREDTKPPAEVVANAVVRLMSEDSAFPAQNAYGLTAVGLQYFGILSKFQSVVAALRKEEVGGDGKISASIVSNNHRYFMMDDGTTVDPVFDFLVKNESGSKFTRASAARINAYPVSVAQGLLAQFAKTSQQKQTAIRDDLQIWFDLTVQRLSSRFNMGETSFNEATSKAHRQRRELEGTLRGCVDLFKERAPEHWRHHLLVSLTSRFPVAPPMLLSGLVSRLEDENGPGLPRKIYFQRKKVRMVEPDTTGV